MLTDRQQQLLEVMESHPVMSIEAIMAHFGISTATAYRDARALVMAGLAVKVSRGVKLAPQSARATQAGMCCYCGSPITERSAFLIQMQDGSRRSTCCAHCGLMVLGQAGVQTALASDFIYGRMVNARQAAYVLGSRVSLCCEPSVLCFSSDDEACRFVLGFSGQVYGLDAAIAQLKALMAL